MVDRPLVGAGGETQHHAISLRKVGVSIVRGSTATYQTISAHPSASTLTSGPMLFAAGPCPAALLFCFFFFLLGLAHTDPADFF